ncbi:hypothetical protein NPIL_669721 [Nephila pilipes]|uniref:Uncharacterized protein n=1 Tax=Nephila pilipes TaxID=299642 RepID=A0A8X6QPX8_NEPPI|nr:hypothetical protein NPIL_669721 [Nephila pilipes]
MRSTHQDKFLFKLQTKCGRNNCLLYIPDESRWETVTAFRLFIGHDCLVIHFYHIGTLTEAACLLCDNSNKPMDKYRLRTSEALYIDTESSRYCFL